MSAFAIALSAIFRDRNMAVDVEYRAGGGIPGVIVRAIKASPTMDMDYQSTRLRSDALIVDVMVAEVAQPRPDDAVVLDGDIYLVDGEPERDSEGLIWRLSLVPEDLT